MQRGLRRFVELQIAMSLGALACLIVGTVLRATPSFADLYYPGSLAYFGGDLVFLPAPVIVWLRVRTGRWGPGSEIAVAMLLPVVAALAVGAALHVDPLAWLVYGMYPLMTVGMFTYMIGSDRRDIMKITSPMT